MDQSTSRKRPWLAALLAALVTGLGHLYLRRVWRALGWLAVLLGVSVFLVDPSTVDGGWGLPDIGPLAIAAIAALGVLSVLDAYFIAHAHNARARFAEASSDEYEQCSNCGRELDADLEFCHWCTAGVDRGRSTIPEDVDD